MSVGATLDSPPRGITHSVDKKVMLYQQLCKFEFKEFDNGVSFGFNS